MRDVMLDLETWGTRPGCAIRSIGAVTFDPRGDELSGEFFYCNVDRESCESIGLKLEQSTVDWWKRQTKQARDILDVEQRSVIRALSDFAEWYHDSGAIRVWSHGANFDEPVLSAAMFAADVPVPWKFWNSRCTRTVYDAFNFDPRSLTRTGTHHNALDDAKHQARCVQAAYAKGRT